MSDFAPTAGAPSGSGHPARETAFARVASLLWHQRELLERLLFTLVSEQFILRAGAVRWLAPADDEVRAAVEELREAEILRAIEVDDLVGRLGVPADTTLRELGEIAPEPWAALLADHRDTLRDLVAEVTATTAENRRLLRSGADAVRDTLGRVGHAVDRTSGTYSANGATVELPIGPVLLDSQA